MNDPVTQPTEVQAEAQALAEAQAGYAGKARAAADTTAPAPVVPAADVQPAAGAPLADSVPLSASTPDPEPAPDLQAEPAKPTAAEAALTQQLEDLKAQVRELKSSGADAATVRKMHGEIGDINRTLKQFAAVKAAEAPAGDELAAALKAAEGVAAEYPDIAGPIVKAIQAMQTRAPASAAAPEPVTPDPQQQGTTTATPPADAEERDEHGYTKVQRAAIEALDEVVPDRHAIKDTPEYQTWFAAWKTPEYRKKVLTSWNPAVVAEPFAAFKAHQAQRKQKQNVIDAAVQPQGSAQAPAATTIPDEAGFTRGYNRAKRLVA